MSTGIDFPAWKSVTCLFMIWTALWLLLEVAPVWCDICPFFAAVSKASSSHILLWRSLPLRYVSIADLYKIASCQTVSVSKAEKRRPVLVDRAIGLGIPLVQMPLRHCIENVGCYLQCRPRCVVFAFIRFTYSSSIGTPSLHPRRPIRAAPFRLRLLPQAHALLLVVASLELFTNIPLSTCGLYLSASRSSIAPWISWAETHEGFSYVGQVPSLLWRADAQTQETVDLSRWAGVTCALAFFAFFGFAAEARKNYCLAFWAVATRFGVKQPADGKLSIYLPWAKAKSSSVGAPHLPRTPVKQHPGSLSPSLADTSTDFDVEKTTDYILPTPSSGSAPPEYMHDIELGAYTHSHAKRPPSPSPSSSSAGSTPRSPPFNADAFFPARPVGIWQAAAKPEFARNREDVRS
ncbi:pheromone A receptor-domain-containing protein [Mycena latifolia]|nr:pheromone A receptor-domain-containing protein [Mycena latifolia]